MELSGEAESHITSSQVRFNKDKDDENIDNKDRNWEDLQDDGDSSGGGDKCGNNNESNKKKKKLNRQKK